MEEAKVRVLQRPQAPNVTDSPAEEKRHAVSWRKISLLATPLVVGLINLLDGYNDRRNAFIESDQHYRMSVESGKGEAEAIISSAEESGKILAASARDTGVKQSHSVKSGAAAKAAEIVEQGKAESELSRLQAEKTKEAVQKIKPNPLDKY